MSNATDLLRNRLRKHFGVPCVDHTALVVPISYTVGLFLNNSGLQAGSPSGEVSSTSTGYARMPLLFNTGVTSNALTNPSEILFGTPTADWGIIPYSGVFAEVSAGTYELWWWNLLTNANTGVPEPITISNDGARCRFQANRIIVTQV